MVELVKFMRSYGIQPTPQRVAVAECLFRMRDHQTADEVLEVVRKRWPAISRATVYNTLNLFAEKGLIRRLYLIEGTTVFDPFAEPHHHIVDVETGEIVDIAQDALHIHGLDTLAGYEILETTVVVRAKKR